MLLLMKPSQKRHRPSRGRWPKLEKGISVGSVDAFSVGSVHTSKEKHPVEPVSLTRRSMRPEGVHRQYVVSELFPSISDTEDDGVEFCLRDEA